MSHAVQINYEQIAVQCHSICEVAENQVAELDKMLADLEGSSSRLLNDQTEALRKQIEREKNQLLKEIQAVLARADEDAKKGIVTGDSDRLNVGQTRAVITTAEQLRTRVNELAAGRLAEMRALLDSLLSESIALNQARMIDRANGVVRLDEATKKFLDTIEDEILRQFVYIAFVRDSSLSGNALLEAGKALMSESVEARYEKEAELIRAELAAAKVPTETVEKIVGTGKPLTEIREAATTEIVGEKVRQKSMKLIKIAKSKLRPVQRAIAEKYRIDLEFEDELRFIDYILGGADSSKGGRDILNAINDKLLDELAMFMFENKQDLSSLKGSKILVKTTKNGLEFSFEND